MINQQTPPEIEQPAQEDSSPNRTRRRLAIVIAFLFLSFACIFCASQSALYFIDRDKIGGGVRARTQANYGPSILLALAPIDRDRIIAEIVEDELALLATPSSVEAGAIVVAVLPKITPVQIQLPTPTPTPTPLPPSTSTSIPPASPTSLPPSPTPEPPTPKPTPPPTSTSTSVAATPTSLPPSPTALPPSPTVPPPTASPTVVLPPPATPTDVPSPSPTALPNSSPVANDDNITVLEDGSMTVDVLANDSDSDGAIDTSTLTIVSGPLHGSAVVNTATGEITYTPDVNYSGADSFIYQICDNDGACVTATVSVTVTAANDAPTAVDDSLSTDEDVSATLPVLSNDFDIDGDSISISAAGLPANGVVVNNVSALGYTPTLNFNGVNVFTYTITDGNLSASATITVTVLPVADAPIAQNDAASTAEDTSEIINVLGNDSDPDGDSLTVISVEAPANGTASTNGSIVLYTPALNFDGTDTFTYTISDGIFTDTATIVVSLIPINDPPIAAADSYTTSVNTPLAISAPGVLGNDTDPEGSVLNAVLVSGPITGTLTLDSSGGFLYTPAGGFSGTDSFTYLANDGVVDSNTVTVVIDVN